MELLEKMPVKELKAKVEGLTTQVELRCGLATALEQVLEKTMEAERAREEEREREASGLEGRWVEEALRGVFEGFWNENGPFYVILYHFRLSFECLASPNRHFV